jgi:hypothetical protein
MPMEEGADATLTAYGGTVKLPRRPEMVQALYPVRQLCINICS